jgi:hypothetical protein
MTMHRRLTRVVASLMFGTLVLAASPSRAQDRMVSLYAGYDFLNTDGGELHGFRVSPEYRLKDSAFLVGDFSAGKGTIEDSRTTILTYLGGIRLKKAVGSVSLFVHALAGGVRTSASIKPFGGVTISVADSGLGLDGGGGAEFHFRGSVRMRLGADYLRRKVGASGGKTSENDIRATVGFVF